MTCAVLIGIPSFRRPDSLRNLLDSLAGQTGVDGLHASVFVADNDPEQRDTMRVCADAAEQFRWPMSCAVVEQPGVAAARNAILAKARAAGSDFVAMLDDDQAAAPDWLSQLLAAQRATAADAVGGRVDYRFAAEPSNAVSRWGYFHPRPRRLGIVPLLTGAGNVLLSCASLRQLDWPLFDVRFGASGGEDAEFFLRLARTGFRYAWAPEAVAFEDVAADRVSEKALLSRAFRTGNNEVRIRRVNGQSGAIMMMFGKAAAVLVAAPVLAPLLVTPFRLWLLLKWASSAGRITAILGRAASFYGKPVKEPASYSG